MRNNPNPTVREILRQELLEEATSDREFAFLVRGYLSIIGLSPLDDSALAGSTG